MQAFVVHKIALKHMEIKDAKKVTFEKGVFVFLKVLTKPKIMKMGKCDKLYPRYCGLFKILKKIGDVAYKLELRESSCVHLVFHVSKLKKSIHELENIAFPKILVDFIKSPKLLHELEKILGYQDRKTQHTLPISTG